VRRKTSKRNSHRRPAIGAAILLAAIAALAVSHAGGAGAADFAFITTTDYITGNSSVIWHDGSHSHDNNVRSLHSDAVARYFDGLIYVVNRMGADNIQILDPGNGFSTIRQFSVGAGSDPHDIVVLGPGKAYVTRYNTNVIWIVDPSQGIQTGSIDLSSLADADGKAEIDMMCRVGNRVFVTVERLDRNTPGWPPVGPSYVAAIDAATNALIDANATMSGVQPITLTGTNPYSDIQLNPYTGRLYVACAGHWGLKDGGVEAINPVSLASEGFLFQETSAGGDITDVEIDRGTHGYAIVNDANFHTALISFDAASGTKTGTLYAPGDYVLLDIEVSPWNELFVSDQTATLPGIRIWDVFSNTQITTSPINVGLPPSDITFSLPVQTGIGDPPAAGEVLSLGDAYPNPFHPAATIPFTLPRSARAAVRIYDALGRRVRVLIDEERPGGAQAVTWDGCDDRGRPVASGVYFVRLESGGQARSGKISRIRANR
jgi:FlgD Ig-like domain